MPTYFLVFAVCGYDHQTTATSSRASVNTVEKMTFDLGKFWTRINFYRTVVMPTYLLLFALCDYGYQTTKTSSRISVSRVEKLLLY